MNATGGARSTGRFRGPGAARREGGEGALELVGHEEGIEVRELEGGVLVVRRSADEKRRSPERLNLHRRQMKSCPVIQVGGRVNRGRGRVGRLGRAAPSLLPGTGVALPPSWFGRGDQGDAPDSPARSGYRSHGDLHARPTTSSPLRLPTRGS